MEKHDSKVPGIMELLGFEFDDYCHCHQWPDASPNDPWCVGVLAGVLVTKSGIFFQLKGKGVPDRWWQRCSKITEGEGERLLMRKETS